MSDTVEVAPVNFAVTRRLVLFLGGFLGGNHLSCGCEGVYGPNSRYVSQQPHNSRPCFQLDST